MKQPPVRQGLSSRGLNNGDVIYLLTERIRAARVTAKVMTSSLPLDSTPATAPCPTHVGEEAISRATLSDLGKNIPHSECRLKGWPSLKFEKDYGLRRKLIKLSAISGLAEDQPDRFP